MVVRVVKSSMHELTESFASIFFVSLGTRHGNSTLISWKLLSILSFLQLIMYDVEFSVFLNNLRVARRLFNVLCSVIREMFGRLKPIRLLNNYCEQNA